LCGENEILSPTHENLLEVISHFDSFLRNMLKNNHKEKPSYVSFTNWEKTFKELADPSI